MEHTSGESQTTSGQGRTESHMHLRTGGGDDGGSNGDFTAHGARERLEGMRDRTTAFAGRARERISEGLDRLNSTLAERTGGMDAVRNHPLTAVGLAFSIAFVAAAVTASGSRSWALDRARRRVRGVILSGITGLVAHEFRSLLGSEEGFGELLRTLGTDLDHEADEDDGEDDEEDDD